MEYPPLFYLVYIYKGVEVPKSIIKSEEVPCLSLLTELLPEPDPLEDAKHRVESISLIVWFIHQWQDGEDEREQSLSLLIKKEVSLTKVQLSMIGEITKTTPEPEVLRRVIEALDYHR